MELKKVWAVYYSATGTTAKVVRAAAEGIAEKLGLPMEERSFTRPGERAETLNFTAEDLVVAGSPTYAGKLPNKLLPDFQEKLRGNGALAVAVVLFGNRSYDNSLAELRAVLEADGFCPMAAGAFVGRHAFTDELAFGRPGCGEGAGGRSHAGAGARRPGGALLRPQGSGRGAGEVSQGQAEDASEQMQRLRRLRPGLSHGSY